MQCLGAGRRRSMYWISRWKHGSRSKPDRERLLHSSATETHCWSSRLLIIGGIERIVFQRSWHMKYRPFGRTGWNLSEVSFGAWAIGGSWGEVSEQAALAETFSGVDYPTGVAAVEQLRSLSPP